MAEVISCKWPTDECLWTSLIIVNIGSGNGLVSSDNKPLPDAILAQIYVVSLGHNELTHWGRNKVATILQTAFPY